MATLATKQKPQTVIIQKGRSSCGPCSFLNILQLKGDDSYTEEMLDAMCVTRLGIGTQNEDMVRVAHQLGFHTTEKANADISDIELAIDEEKLVIVNYTNAFSGNGHYSVIVDYDEHALYFHDSSLGALRLPKHMFLKFWHGTTGPLQWMLVVE